MRSCYERFVGLVAVLAVALTTVSSNVALAGPVDGPTQAEFQAALAVIKESGAKHIPSSDLTAARTLLEVGASTTAAGVVAIALGHGISRYAISTLLPANSVHYFTVLHAAEKILLGGLATVSGGVVVLLTAAVMYLTTPASAQAATIDSYYVYSEYTFNEFLNLDVDHQIQWSGPKTRTAVVALAGQILKLK